MNSTRPAVGTLIALVTTGLFLAILSSSTIISGVSVSSQSINSGGSITSINVEIFNNYECTEPCTNINWGIITPGESTHKTIYIKNTGNKPITLFMRAENWIPINAEAYLSLTWDKENFNLNPDEIVTTTITLEIAQDINSIDDFNFDIIITGIE